MKSKEHKKSLANEDLILEYKPWCEAIAKTVAKAWNLDWKLDGLDGAAYEALIFCAGRFEVNRGVPFKGYARRRIHEAATEAARQSRGWRRGAGTNTRTERLAREVSSELFDVFPELRSGLLPFDHNSEGTTQGQRIAVQQLLIGASVLATKKGLEAALPDEALEFKKMFRRLTKLNPLHQLLLWKVYWDGLSLRGVAAEWNTDELNVIREHTTIMKFLIKLFESTVDIEAPKVRPGLQDVERQVINKGTKGAFFEFEQGNSYG